MPPADTNTARSIPSRTEWVWVAAASVLVAAFSSLPYLVAYGVRDHVFTGILINPVDGNSYLAKMAEGWRGEWLFTLPYTADPGPGALIFAYYLFLGHLARWTGASLDLIYHLARVAGGLALLPAAYAFVARFFFAGRWRMGVWLLFVLGSGLGWLGVLFDAFTSDLWVAEAIPFLAIFSNAHFALALALQLWIFLCALPGLAPERTKPARLVLLALATTLEAQVQPLALLNIGVTLAGVIAWHLIRRRLTWARLLPGLVVAVFALPWVLYDAALSYTHPTLSQWSAQNLTPAPPMWDLVLSGGALLLLAIPGAIMAARRRTEPEMAVLIWLVLGGLALYAPFALQRRLALGLWMPLVLLAGMGLREAVWPRLGGSAGILAIAALGLLVMPSNLLVYGAALGAIQRREPAVFLALPEAAALDWLAGKAPHGSVVAASPSMSLFIPARTPARVVYGHPFETIAAAAHRRAVEDFYAGLTDPVSFVTTYRVQFVLVGPREHRLGRSRIPAEWPRVFEHGGVVLYAP
jgi:hypothetical protein